MKAKNLKPLKNLKDDKFIDKRIIFFYSNT